MSEAVYWLIPPQTEKQLQSEIVQWLCLAAPDALVYEFARPGGHRALAGAVPVGWPDLLVILPGPIYLHMEVKRPGGRLSPGQERVYRELSGQGCGVGVISSVEAAAYMLRANGYEPRMAP